MFYHKSHGTCTSWSIYATTVLRALGIPTRMVLAIPAADPCDRDQVRMVEAGIKHHEVRAAIIDGIDRVGPSFASHTFNEVYIGHRWRRLNYTTLGQNILDRNYFGLMIHVHTFRDLDDANLTATWGWRYGQGKRDAVFRFSNPYRTMSISDSFGAHAKVKNPPVKEHKAITISKAYWAESAAPTFMKSWAAGLKDGDGHVLIHGDEWFDDRDHLQYKTFMRRADKQFFFRAEGRPEVHGQVSMNFFTHAADKVREVEIVIPRGELAKMASGVPYRVHAANATSSYKWKVAEGVTLTKR